MDKLNTHEEVVKLLWTGGFDSTFRLLELSRQNCVVQPIYLYGDGRRSINYEIRAMERILDLVSKYPETQAEILPLIKVDIATIPQNKKITLAYQNIIKENKLGSQYEWIARYAAVNPKVELCVEKERAQGIGYLQKIIGKEGSIVATGNIHNFKVETTSHDVRLLLDNVLFPIINKTEIDMINTLKNWGGTTKKLFKTYGFVITLLTESLVEYADHVVKKLKAIWDFYLKKKVCTEIKF